MERKSKKGGVPLEQKGQPTFLPHGIMEKRDPFDRMNTIVKKAKKKLFLLNKKEKEIMQYRVV